MALVYVLEVVVLPEHVLFAEFAERWMTEVAPLRLKPTAVAQYRSLLDHRLLSTFHDRRMSEITPDEIQAFMAHQVEEGYAPRSVRNDLAVLRALFKTAVAFGVVETNPAMKVTAPKHFRKEQRFLTPAEMKAVLEAAPTSWVLLLALPMYAAARVGECLALRWPQVSPERRQIAFVRSMRAGVEHTVKSEASRASVAMNDDLAVLFEERRRKVPDPVEGFVFCRGDGTPLGDRVPGRLLHRACLKAGIEPCGFHTLRHSAIAALIATGAHPLVVSRFARHASIGTTMDVYGHLMAPAAGDAVSDLGRLLRNS